MIHARKNVQFLGYGFSPDLVLSHRQLKTTPRYYQAHDFTEMKRLLGEKGEKQGERVLFQLDSSSEDSEDENKTQKKSTRGSSHMFRSGKDS